MGGELEGWRGFESIVLYGDWSLNWKRKGGGGGGLVHCLGYFLGW